MAVEPVNYVSGLMDYHDLITCKTKSEEPNNTLVLGWSEQIKHDGKHTK